MIHRNDDRGLISGTSLLCFFLGAAVGAAVAILYAPTSGEETREQIAAKAGELKGKATDLKDQVMDRAGQWKETAATRIQEMKGRATDTIDTVRRGANNVSDTARDEMANVADTMRS